MTSNEPAIAIASNPSTADLPKPFSITLPSSKPKARTQTISNRPNPKKRLYSNLTDSESDKDGLIGGPQLVASFDQAAGGAIGIDPAQKTKVPLVIQGLKNRDWREESRKKRSKNLLPAEVQALRSGQDPTTILNIEVNDAKLQEFGLSFVQSPLKVANGDITMVEAHTVALTTENKPDASSSIEEEALEALLGNGVKKSTLVLSSLFPPAGTTELVQTQAFLNEDELFRSDVASRPDPAKFENYVAVPVEEFGAALLRGMGWKDGDVIGNRKSVISKVRVMERRPALLGIGAKEVPAGFGEELGAWGKDLKGKRKTEQAYNPVVLKNSITGELLTEEELEAKKKDRRKEEIEWKSRKQEKIERNRSRDRELVAEEGRRSEREYHQGRKRPQEGRHISRHARSRSLQRDRFR